MAKTDDHSSSIIDPEWRKSDIQRALGVLWPDGVSLAVTSPLDAASESIRKQLAEQNAKIVKLEEARQTLWVQLQKEKEESTKQSGSVDSLNATNKKYLSAIEALRKEKELSHLLPRVCEAGKEKLLSSNEFRQNFDHKRTCSAFVMSVDIRRSTELMLKAKKPEYFADFTTDLCDRLLNVVTSEFGVFDKFTGDGILCFFPDFFSGKDSAYRVLRAAFACHKCFKETYGKHYDSFSSVLLDVGLGIGIDFGTVSLVNSFGGLTVVGDPVVYACRIGGCPHGLTLVTRRAFREMAEFSAQLKFEETNVEIKHEGKTLAYKAEFSGVDRNPLDPEWLRKEIPNDSKPPSTVVPPSAPAQSKAVQPTNRGATGSDKLEN